MRYRPSALGTTRFVSRPAGEDVEAFDLTALRECMERGSGFSMRRAELPKRPPHSFVRGGNRHEAFDRPAVQSHDRTAETARDRDLAERAPTLADRNHALGGGDDQDVAGLTHPSRQRYREMRVGAGSIRAP